MVAVALAVAFGGLLALRFRAAHPGLVYPDAFDYRLMAHGLATHWSPRTTLGPGGAAFVPSPDATAKPLYPALLAVAQVVGVRVHAAADALTAIAGAAIPLLTAAVALRLTRSVAAAVIACCVILLSGPWSYWDAFALPDALAMALAMASVLLVMTGRPRTSAVMAGLAIAARPEIGAGFAFVAVAAIPERTVGAIARFAASAWLVTALVYLGTRMPLPSEYPSAARLTFTLVAVASLLVAGAHIGARSWMTPLLAVAAVAFCVSHGHGFRTVLVADWPVLAVAILAPMFVSGVGARRVTIVALAVWTLLTILYAVKSPAVARYHADLVPLLALAAAVAVAERPKLGAAVLGASAVALGLAWHAPRSGVDYFAVTAHELRRLHLRTIVSATPDAYAVLLPGVSEQQLAPGERGVVLLDAAARLYSPALGACGRLIARVPNVSGFERPSGGVDLVPGKLVVGRVVARRDPCHPPRS